MRKVVLLAALLIISSAQAKNIDWMSVTCAELRTEIQQNELVVYGSHKYFNKSIVARNQQDAFCQDFLGDFRMVSTIAGPVRATDKRGFNLCSLRGAFSCRYKVGN